MVNIRTNVETSATICVFVASLLAPLIDHLALDIDPSPQIDENRYLAALPSPFEAESLERFREDFERYHRDHLGLRDSLIRLNSLLDLRVLRKPIVTVGEMSVFVGSDDWLYFGYTMRDYMGDAELTPEQLDWWTRVLHDRAARLAQLDVPYVFFNAPVKVDVYPEHLPAVAQPGPNPRSLDKLLSRAPSHPNLLLLDLRPALLDAKSWHELYWRTDHHWNAPGAFVAANAVIERLQPWFPQLSPHEREDVICIESAETGPLSLSRGLGLSGFFNETRHELSHPRWSPEPIERSRDEHSGDLVYTNNANPDGLRLIIIGDSFTFELLPILAQHFSRVRFVGRWGLDYELEMLESVVRDEAAHLVLEERTGWALLEATP